MSSTLSSSDRIPAERNQDAEADRTMGPAKSTRADAPPVQRRLAEESQGLAAATTDSASAVQKKQRAGDWDMTPELSSALGLTPAPDASSSVQRKPGSSVSPSGAASGGGINEIASQGVANASSSLPHLDAIQRSFGGHDVSGIRAEVGGAAAESSRAIGAEAYATGGRVAFASAPDLHTAAHEAAHVVQQREGVQLKGGVGEAGDRYEQHADAVADAVVAGRSAEPILNEMAPSAATSGSAGGAVQRRPVASGNSNAGQQFTDHRGSITMTQISENVYEIGGKQYTYYAQSDQYQNNETGLYWDPASGVERAVAEANGEWWYYAPDGPSGWYAYRDGTYQLHQAENTGGGQYDGSGGYSGYGGSQWQDDEEVAPDDEHEQQLASFEVPIMNAAKLIEESCKSKALTKMFIESALLEDARRALTLFRSWNASYAEVEQQMKEQEEASGPTKQTNKRKAGQSSANKTKAVFAPLTWAELGLSAEQMVGKLQSDTRREAEHDQQNKKKKREYLSELEYNGATYQVSLLSDGGGYYDVYNITDVKKILPDRENSDLVLRIPKDGPNPELAGKGMQSHGQLSSRRVPVPQVRNNARRDGFFLVEKIANEFNPTALMNRASFAELEPHEQRQLTQIRGVLESNARVEQAVVPDFRPSNLRFRASQSPEVVLVDFTDEADLGHMRGDDFWRDMKGILLEFCNRQESHWIYTFLTQNFSAQQLQAIERANEF